MRKTTTQKINRWDTRRARASLELDRRINGWVQRYRGLFSDDDLIATLHSTVDGMEAEFEEEREAEKKREDAMRRD